MTAASLLNSARAVSADVWVRVNASATWRAQPADWRDYRDWGPFADWKVTFRVPSWVHKRQEDVWRYWRPSWRTARAHSTFDTAYNQGGYNNSCFRSLGNGYDEMTFTVGWRARHDFYGWWQNGDYASELQIEYLASGNSVGRIALGNALTPSSRTLSLLVVPPPVFVPVQSGEDAPPLAQCGYGESLAAPVSLSMAGQVTGL